jgi:hypothetical protein
VVVTLRRPNLKPSSGFAMAKAKRQSNNPRTKAPSYNLDTGPIKPPPEWRPSSKYPGYYEVDDLPKPALTVTHFSELLALANTATYHFRDYVDVNGNVRQKMWVLEEWFQTKRLSNGELVTPRLATMLATIVRGVEARKGGRPPSRTKR